MHVTCDIPVNQSTDHRQLCHYIQLFGSCLLGLTRNHHRIHPNTSKGHMVLDCLKFGSKSRSIRSQKLIVPPVDVTFTSLVTQYLVSAHIQIMCLHSMVFILVGFPRSGILPVSCHFIKKTLLDRCGQTWIAQPLFLIVLWRVWQSPYTTSAPTPHQFTTLHCNAVQLWRFLNAL